MGFWVEEEEQAIINRNKFFNLYALGKLDRLWLGDGSFLWVDPDILRYWNGAMMREAHKA